VPSRPAARNKHDGCGAKCSTKIRLGHIDNHAMRASGIVITQLHNHLIQVAHLPTLGDDPSSAGC
jgi:hypothetical protein